MLGRWRQTNFVGKNWIDYRCNKIIMLGKQFEWNLFSSFLDDWNWRMKTHFLHLGLFNASRGSHLQWTAGGASVWLRLAPPISSGARSDWRPGRPRRVSEVSLLARQIQMCSWSLGEHDWEHFKTETPTGIGQWSSGIPDGMESGTGQWGWGLLPGSELWLWGLARQREILTSHQLSTIVHVCSSCLINF